MLSPFRTATESSEAYFVCLGYSGLDHRAS